MNSGEPSSELPVVDLRTSDAPVTIALVGNPNSGKTSLFNCLTGLRAQTANFSGTTVERRQAPLLGNNSIQLVDLPGLYSFETATPDEQVAVDVLLGKQSDQPQPAGLIIVADSTNLARHLALASEALELGQPTLLALNMSDLAERLGLEINIEQLSERLGCQVVPVSARTGTGLEQLKRAVHQLAEEQPASQFQNACGSCVGCSHAERFDWAESVRSDVISGDFNAPSRRTDTIDRLLTHPVGGLLVFALVMYAMFMSIFSVATIPMDLIDTLFAWAGDTVGTWLPDGDFKSLIVDGLIAGVGGMVIFLPQICMLFFLLALLEGSGYLARAALVMDRLMQSVGLPGKAFVPLLSAHACAIPAIMSSRVIDDRRDRLVTILVAPLMTCSARVPVYVMVVSMLFPNDPLKASLVFAGAYVLGIVAALAMAWIFKKTILPGESRPLVIELPNYRLPSLRGAFIETAHRAWDFLQNAGTIILVISLVLWALATYPKTTIEELPEATRGAIEALSASGDNEAADAMLARESLERSAIGRLGQAFQPIFAPLGFDWKTTVGVGASFAAREVIVSTLSILYGLGEEGEESSLLAALESARDSSGELVFDTATCLSLLVFYVLAMQCLPTQAVTRRETNSWRWPIFQLVYMSLLAYVSALVVYQSALFLT